MSDDLSERIANIIAEHVGERASVDDAADAILASGVLDQIKADAWDEGWRDGLDTIPRDPRHDEQSPRNPYRKEGATT